MKPNVQIPLGSPTLWHNLPAQTGCGIWGPRERLASGLGRATIPGENLGPRVGPPCPALWWELCLLTPSLWGRPHPCKSQRKTTRAALRQLRTASSQRRSQELGRGGHGDAFHRKTVAPLPAGEGTEAQSLLGLLGWAEGSAMKSDFPPLPPTPEVHRPLPPTPEVHRHSEGTHHIPGSSGCSRGRHRDRTDRGHGQQTDQLSETQLPMGLWGKVGGGSRPLGSGGCGCCLILEVRRLQGQRHGEEHPQNGSSSEGGSRTGSLAPALRAPGTVLL